MVRKCVILGCDSKSSMAAHHGVTYHSFPFDSKAREKWMEYCRIPAQKNITKSVLVCSRHFRRADFLPMKNGKYLLKQGAMPSVFPWGKIDTPQSSSVGGSDLDIGSGGVIGSDGDTAEEASKVALTVAQIMAETAELNAIAGIKSPLIGAQTKESNSTTTGKRTSTELLNEERPPKIPRSSFDSAVQDAAGGSSSTSATSVSSPAMSPLITQQVSIPRKMDSETIFTPGVRLEAQDFDGVWHSAKVVEVDNDDREVLIKFEKSGKNKNASIGSEEWIPMKSTRLRQKISTITKPCPIFSLEEKCLARWTGSRKYAATVKKCLGNDLYEVLFYDGFVKVLKATHMSKIRQNVSKSVPVNSPGVNVPLLTPNATQNSVNADKIDKPIKKIKTIVDDSISASPLESTRKNKSRGTAGTGQSQKDWPLISRASLDLEALNLPEIPKDGEWTCHWVNDQPIGKEGFLIVGDHKKPTVIVEDWRLPPDWVKHMYQRSNVLGKWDVILVNPQGKRFRSKADLKIFIEELGQVYNPDIYDFSIHRRRAKDIGAYAYTPDYTRTQPKPKLESSISTIQDTSDLSHNLSIPATSDIAALKDDLPPVLDATVVATSLAATSNLYAEAPVATLVPPIELMTSPAPPKSKDAFGKNSNLDALIQPDVGAKIAEDGYAYIGGLKVQIIDNLFRCPQEGCFKNFRKENHLQIHVKHYHQDLNKLLGECPNMQDLASKRTLGNPEHDVHPKNQIPNQQFFAKLHQQDLEQSRAHRRSAATAGITTHSTTPTSSATASPLHVVAAEENQPSIALDTNLTVTEIKIDNTTMDIKASSPELLSQSLVVTDESTTSVKAEISIFNVDEPTRTPIKPIIKEKLKMFKTAVSTGRKHRFPQTKRTLGARKSSRQRTTKKYLTAAAATAAMASSTTGRASTRTLESFGAGEFEETRHSFNATPDAKPTPCPTTSSGNKKPKNSNNFSTITAQLALTAPATPLSAVDSPLTADGSHTNSSSCFAPSESPKYIKENGELIKIVRMRQEEIINCLCSYGEEDGLMIQCELCLCWQHGICNGIDKQSDVPEKYVCYICRNPQRGRESLKYIHDQDWLYDGKLPVGYYHEANPMHAERFEILRKSHTLTGNLIDLKRFMHSLRVKINIAGNKDHPKMYLWEKPWDTVLCKKDLVANVKDEIKTESNENNEETIGNTIKTETTDNNETPAKTEKLEPHLTPNVPQPEAPIDPVECQHRLFEHIKVQQELAMNRINDIEKQIDELVSRDNLPDLKSADDAEIKEVLATMIKDLQTMKQLSKINVLTNAKQHSVINPIVMK